MSGLKMKIVTAAAALLFSAGLAVAQAPAPSPTTAPKADTGPAVAPVKKSAAVKKSAITPKEERTPESLACSAEADQKALKGKERVNFRKKCIAAAKKGSPAKSAAVKKQ